VQPVCLGGLGAARALRVGGPPRKMTQRHPKAAHMIHVKEYPAKLRNLSGDV